MLLFLTGEEDHDGVKLSGVSGCNWVPCTGKAVCLKILCRLQIYFFFFVKTIEKEPAASPFLKTKNTSQQKSGQGQKWDMFNKLEWLKTDTVVRPEGKHPREWRKGHTRGDILTVSCEGSLQTLEVLMHERDTGEKGCQHSVGRSFQVTFNSRNKTQLFSVYTTECFWYWSTGQHLFIIQINLMFWYLELSAFNILGSSSHKAALKSSSLNLHYFAPCISPLIF